MNVQRLRLGLLNGSVSQKEAELLHLAVTILQTIYTQIPSESNEWFANNIKGLPQYLSTKDGGTNVSLLVDCYREYIEKQSQ